jgi:hypothetical protein
MGGVIALCRIGADDKGLRPNGIKLGRTHDLLLGFFKHLLYVWASKPLLSRR